MIFSLLLIFLIPYSSALYINVKNSFILTSANFSQETDNFDYYVLFIEDPLNHEKFLDLWDEVAEIAKTEELSRNLKFGIVDCYQNREICRSNHVNAKIELQFFGRKNYWTSLKKFIDSTIVDVLREDDLIERFDKPGNMFVLFKVVYCPYCKEAMDEWISVKQHFDNNPNVFVASLDCTRHRDQCARFDALKFPRIRFISNSKNGKQTVENYDGERTAQDMIEYCKLSLERFQ